MISASTHVVDEGCSIPRTDLPGIARTQYKDHVSYSHNTPLAHCSGYPGSRARYHWCAPLFICASSPRSARSLANSASAIQWHYFANGLPMKRRPSVGRGRAESTECVEQGSSATTTRTFSPRQKPIAEIQPPLAPSPSCTDDTTHVHFAVFLTTVLMAFILRTFNKIIVIFVEALITFPIGRYRPTNL